MLHRRYRMKRTAMFVFVTAAMLLAGAWAGGLPQQGTVRVVDDQGVLVGAGSVHDGTIEITLADAASGFVSLLVSEPNGKTTRVQALVPVDGSLHVVASDGVLPARAFAARNAMALEIHAHANVEASNAPAGSGQNEPFESGENGSVRD